MKAQGQMPTNKWSDTLDVSGTSAQEVSVWEPLSKGRTPGYFYSLMYFHLFRLFITRLGVRQTVSSRNRLSSLNILAGSNRSAQPLSRLPPNLGLRRL